MSPRSRLSTASWEKSSPDSFVKKYEEEQKAKRAAAALAHPRPLSASDIIIRFLVATKIPYIVIGGRAVVYHLLQIEHLKASSPSPSGSASATKKLAKLAKSTEDYDIYCDKVHAAKFIDEMQLALANRGFELKESETDDEKVTMIGNLKKGIFDSVIDIHVPKKKMVISSIVGGDGITYASVEWICGNLKNILEHKSSQFETLKYEKRKARFRLLKCAAPASPA